MYSCCCVLNGGPGSSQTLSSLFWPSSFLPLFLLLFQAQENVFVEFNHQELLEFYNKVGLEVETARQRAWPSSSALYTLCMHFVCLFCLSHVLFLPACSTLSDKSPPALKQFATSEALLFLCAPFSVFKNVWECAARLYAPRLSPDFLFFSWKSCKASWIPWLDVRRSLRMCHPTTTPPQHTHTSSLHLLPDYDMLKMVCLCLY